MANRKRARSESGGQREPEVGSGGNRILENWQEDRNRPSLERRGRTGALVQVGAGSKGINFWIHLPLSTFVQVLSRVLRAPKP